MGKARGNERYRRRRKKRRGLRVFLTLLTFCIVIGAIIASLTVFLKVSKIEVNGATKYKKEDIIATSGIQKGDNLFGINKFNVSSVILKKYPYIETIKITRRLPDTFVFDVTERVICGYIDVSDQRWIVDKFGYLLERVPQKTQVKGAKILAGEPALAPNVGSKINWTENEKLNALITIFKELDTYKMTPKVGQVDVSMLYQLSFSYDNRLRVVLGTTEDLPKKLKMFHAVLEKLSPTDRGTVNLSNVKQARFAPNASIKF